MICKDCAQAADLTAKVQEAAKMSNLWATSPILPVHPGDCNCTCQHKPPGSWKGQQSEVSEGTAQ